MRAESINAATSDSSNKPTRALILCRAIFPASPQRKIVRAEIPKRSAIAFALLNFLPANPSDDCAAGTPKVFATVCMANTQRIALTAANAGPPPNLRYSTYLENGRSNAPSNTAGFEEPAFFFGDLGTGLDERRKALTSSLRHKSLKIVPENCTAFEPHELRRVLRLDKNKASRREKTYRAFRSQKHPNLLNRRPKKRDRAITGGSKKPSNAGITSPFADSEYGAKSHEMTDASAPF